MPHALEVIYYLTESSLANFLFLQAFNFPKCYAKLEQGEKQLRICVRNLRCFHPIFLGVEHNSSILPWCLIHSCIKCLFSTTKVKFPKRLRWDLAICQEFKAHIFASTFLSSGRVLYSCVVAEGDLAVPLNYPRIFGNPPAPPPAPCHS